MIDLINNKRLGGFLKFLQFNLLPIKGQRGKKEGEFVFVEDWLTIELSKAFYIGPERYLEDPIPRRLEGNPLFSQEEVLDLYTKKQEALSELEERKEESNHIFITQIGRGLDILLTSFIKDWEIYHCYDNDERYKDLLPIFFPERIEFYTDFELFTFLKETSNVFKYR